MTFGTTYIEDGDSNSGEGMQRDVIFETGILTLRLPD